MDLSLRVLQDRGGPLASTSALLTVSIYLAAGRTVHAQAAQTTCGGVCVHSRALLTA